MTREQIGTLVLKVQNAFFDRPGLMLTPRQAQRLFRADETACREVMNVLAGAGVITKHRDGTYTLPLAHAA